MTECARIHVVLEKDDASGLARGGASAATLFGIASTAAHFDIGVSVRQDRAFFLFTRTPSSVGRRMV